MLKIKANSVKQEFEKMEELKRSAMRAVVNLQTISDSGKSLKLDYLIDCILVIFLLLVYKFI